MRRLGPVLFACLAMTGSVSAQTWSATVSGEGATRFGTAMDLGRNLFFRCNTRPADGGDRHIDGNNWFPVNLPFAMNFEIGDVLVSVPFDDSSLANVTLWVDGTGYRLPPLAANVLYDVWEVELSMADPMVQSLHGAQTLVLDAGQGQAWSFPTDGLSDALDQALGSCVEGWAGWGRAVPAALGRYRTQPGAAPPLPAGPVIPPAMDAHIRQGCDAGYQLNPDHLGQADFDRDGQADLILDWSNVTCGGAMARPYCGAAYCSIEVFLSTRPGLAPVEFLGVGYELPMARNGFQGIRFGGTAGGCARGECDDIFWWDGAQFQRQP